MKNLDISKPSKSANKRRVDHNNYPIKNEVRCGRVTGLKGVRVWIDLFYPILWPSDGDIDYNNIGHSFRFYK